MSQEYTSDVQAIDALAAKYQVLRKEIAKVIVGQDEVVKAVLISLFSNGHSLLVGVPGLAKTLLVSTISEVLDLEFKRIQFRSWTKTVISSLTGARFSPILSSRMKSTVPRLKPRPPCWKLCRSDLSLSMGSGTCFHRRSSFWLPKIQSNRKEPTHCLKHSWTGLCSIYHWTILPMTKKSR